MSMEYFLGIDFGTSGVRAVIIDSQRQIQQQSRVNYAIENITSWQIALAEILKSIEPKYKKQLRSILIDGTSSTVVICDSSGNPLDEPILYNDARGAGYISYLDDIVAQSHLVKNACSSLVKLLWWSDQPIFTKTAHFLHQADWLSFLLHGQLGLSDYNNALKLGYDPEQMIYPDWLTSLPVAHLLPKILTPGTPIAKIRTEISDKYKIDGNCQIVAGTTDSIAAFISSDANSLGDGVTSLGSTLVIKMLARENINNSHYGIYSHRLGNHWLTGGASNSGGAVLKEFFSTDQLYNLSRSIDPLRSSGLDYYPLLRPGERFPFNDPNFAPRLEPRPKDDQLFLQGLLEGIARIESRGYELLRSLGAGSLTRVYSVGGGAKNESWRQMREHILGVRVLNSSQTEAAYGAAKLAMGPF